MSSIFLARSQSESKLIAKNTTRYQAYIVLNATTGQILEANKAFLKWPPASLTKLMLAYIVMQKLYRAELKLSDQIKRKICD